jgi:hypothetical protein
LTAVGFTDEVYGGEIDHTEKEFTPGGDPNAGFITMLADALLTAGQAKDTLCTNIFPAGT